MDTTANQAEKAPGNATLKKVLAMALWVALLILLGIVLQKLGLKMLLVGIGAVVLIALSLRKPDIATYSVLFIIYGNFVAVAHQFYGVPRLASGAVILLLAIPMFHHAIVRGEGVVIDRHLILFLFLIAVMLASAIFAAKDIPLALRRISEFLLEGLLLYFLIVNVVRNMRILRHAVWALLLAGTFMGGLTLFQNVTGTLNNNYGGFAQAGGRFSVGESFGKRVERMRSAGPIGEKNRYAQMMLVLFPLAIFRFWQEKNKWLKLAAVVAMVCILGGVILSVSRGAFLGLVVVLVLLALMRYIHFRQLLTVGAVVVAIILLVAPFYLTRMATLTRIGALFSGEKYEAGHVVMSRAMQNLAALNVFIDHPILGVGPAHYSRYYSKKYVNALEVIYQRQSSRRAHSFYLEALAETGILGFVALMAIIVSIVRLLWRLRRRWLAQYPDLAHTATAFLLSIVAYMVSAIFLHLSYLRFFWLIVALASAAILCIQSEAESRAEARLRS